VTTPIPPAFARTVEEEYEYLGTDVAGNELVRWRKLDGPTLPALLLMSHWTAIGVGLGIAICGAVAWLYAIEERVRR